MIAPPKQAMVLAAGLGVRLRPLTLDRPKALVEVAGRTLVERTLDRLQQAGVTRVIINLHYKGTLLRRALAARTAPEILFSDESERLLDTGGGIRKALAHFAGEPFYAVNCDIIWRDAAGNSLHRLAQAFDPAIMDALLLMQPTIGAIGYDGMGDFNLDPLGKLTRRDRREVAPFVFTGVQILHPRLFEDCREEPFSLNRLYDRAAEQDRLFGLAHEGDWIDVGTPAGLAAAAAHLAPRRRE